MPLIRRYFQGERRNVGVGALTLAAILGAHAMLETTRDALFLSSLPSSELPWVYLAVAGFSLIVVAAQRRAGKWLRRRIALGAILWAGAVVTISFYFVPRSPAVLKALYVWSALLATVSIGQFWLLIAERFY